jgi:hypothetical protein
MEEATNGGGLPLARSLSVADGLDFFDLDQGSVSTLGTYRTEVGHGYGRAPNSRDRGR